MAHEKNSPQTPAPAPNETVLAIRELVEALQRRNPSDQDTLGLSPERQASLSQKTPPRRYRSVMVKGSAGATAIARVCEEKGMANGRIVWLEKYTYPAGMLKHESNGGRVPDGMPIARNKDSVGILFAMQDSDKEPDQMVVSFPYLRWKLETFYWKDARDEWLGKELKAHHCDPAGPGLATPWEKLPGEGASDQAAE